MEVGLDENVGMEPDEADALAEDEVPVLSFRRFSLSSSLIGSLISAGEYKILELESTRLGSENNPPTPVFSESRVPPGDKGPFGNMHLDRWPLILQGEEGTKIEPGGDMTRRLVRRSILFSRFRLTSSASLTFARMLSIRFPLKFSHLDVFDFQLVFQHLQTKSYSCLQN